MFILQMSENPALFDNFCGADEQKEIIIYLKKLCKIIKNIFKI